MARSSFEGFPRPVKDGGGTKTGDATATAGQILAAKTAYVGGLKVTGTMPDRSGSNQVSIGSVVGGTTLYLTPPAGYYDGVWNVSLTDADWIAANIPLGLDIFGLVGTGTNAKRVATGSTTSSAGQIVTITGLAFRPGGVIMWRNNPTAAQKLDLIMLIDTPMVYHTGSAFANGYTGRYSESGGFFGVFPDGSTPMTSTGFTYLVAFASQGYSYKAWE